MKKLLTILTLFFALSAIQCFAQELKIGIVNINQILQKAPLMTTLNDGLLKKFQPRQTELIDAQKQVQEESNNFTLNNASLSADERSKQQNKIIADQANVQILTATLQRDLAIAKDEALKKFMTKLNSAISKIAQSGNYDLIEQNTNFVFVNSRYDITQEVLKEF